MIQAWTKAGLSVEEYNRMPGTGLWLFGNQTMSKSHLLIWFRLQGRIEAAGTSADIRKTRLRSKRKSAGNFSLRKRR